MSDFNLGGARSYPTQADMSVDAGLRSFMLGVYNKMALGLLLSAALAYVTTAYAPVRDLLYVVKADGSLNNITMLGTAVRFLPLVVIIGSMFALRNPSPRAAGALYWTIVTSIGAGAGIWLLMYTGASVFMTFLITAAAFGGLSLFGYVTKRDLTGMGSFLIMGVWGLVLASLANMFLNLPMMSFVINALGVLIFSGLVAFDTQRLKLTYYEMGGDQASMGVATSYGALNLYLNFINLFQFLLAFVGVRR